ncbi:MAG: glycoside-pentoside-hexuronide (GPH):cation symporter [Sphingobium sp.]|nr:glycoside-pentoside-hexuronide (GPH):cation symporter [Sphingobium sp.]
MFLSSIEGDVKVEQTGSVTRVSLGIKIGYALGLYGIAIAQTGFTVLLVYCYTDVFGLTPGQAGTIIFVGSFIDIAVNLLIPSLTAATKTRLGRYRPYVIFGSIFFGAAFGAMFIRPDLPPAQLFVYALCIHLAYRFTYGFILTPHSSLISRMTSDADERASIGSVKTIGSNLGVLCSAYVGLGLVAWLGNGNDRVGFTYFGLVFGFLVFLSVCLSGIASKERDVNDAVMDQETGSILPALSLIGRNTQLLFALAATAFYFAAYLVLNSAILYYFKYVREASDAAKMALLAVSLGGIVMPLFWTPIVRRTSKAAVWAIGCALICVASLSLWLFSEATLALILVAYVVAGMGKSAIQMNYFAITADAVDYGHWRHGRRAEAYSFGLLSIMTKVGYGMGGAIVGLALTWSGFVANSVQTPETIERLRIMAGLLPALLVTISGLLVLGFRVNARKHREIVSDLQARANGGG